MTLLSDILGGGGGQTLYDIVVDAGGDGDYTDLKVAMDTEAAGTSFWIRNGAYTVSTAIDVKPGVKVVGESRDGVVITWTGASFSLFKLSFGAYRGGTERLADNTNWDTTSMGLFTPSIASATVGYAGATAPVAGDMVYLAPNFYAFVDSVSAPNFTMDRLWPGNSATVDGFVVDTVLTDLDTRTEFRNFSITQDNASSQSSFQVIDSCHNVHVSDVKIYAKTVGSSRRFIDVTACTKSSFNNIEIDGNRASSAAALRINNGFIDSKFSNIVAYGLEQAIQLTGQARAIRRSLIHFTSFQGSSGFNTTPQRVYRSHIKVDTADCDNLSISSGSTVYFESLVEFGTTNVTVNNTVFEGISSIFKIGYINKNVSISNVADTRNNILNDSYILGTLTADSELIIGGGVAYDSLSGAPAQNNGYEF